MIRICSCGCGKKVEPGNRFINHHNSRVMTKVTKQKISKSLRKNQLNEEESFWSKIDKDGPIMSGMKTKCWVWTAYKAPYGMFYPPSGSFIFAHRYAWKRKRGRILKGKSVLHRCDNPPCVRFSHLFLGTAKDNAKDMLMKGRALIGENNSQAKLKEKDVRYIRATYIHRSRVGSGTSSIDLAIKFDVSVSAIHHVVDRLVWRHIRE
jgi:hypothetical protein